MKNIYIVLTRTNMILSKTIHQITKDEYTHAAISLDKNLEIMYSFGRKNPRNPFLASFKKETIHTGVYGMTKTLPGKVIEIIVSEEQYIIIKTKINEISANESNYQYNYIGLFLHLFSIPYISENRFLCSEFVYYLLQVSGVVKYDISRNLVKPQMLLMMGGKMIYSGDLKKKNVR